MNINHDPTSAITRLCSHRRHRHSLSRVSSYSHPPPPQCCVVLAAGMIEGGGVTVAPTTRLVRPATVDLGDSSSLGFNSDKILHKQRT